MDGQRRFMLLDGFIAPNSGGRSVASVVENRLIGIVGNCLVLPVARGVHLDPTYRQDAENPMTCSSTTRPTIEEAPMRIALPTRAVFAEAVMGACDACESQVGGASAFTRPAAPIIRLSARYRQVGKAKIGGSCPHMP